MEQAKPATALQKASPAPQRLRLRRGDHEFLPAALEILETPPSPVRMSLILLICGFAVAALSWAYLGHIDIIAVAQGKIQPVGRTKTIQPVATGKVEALDVENGTKVHAGDVLVELDPSEARADEAGFAATLQSLRAEIARRRLGLGVVQSRKILPLPKIRFDADIPAAMGEREQRVLDGDLRQLADVVASLRAQVAQKNAERERLKDTITAEERLVATQQQRVDMRATLVKQSAESKANLIDAEETLQTQQTYLANLKGQLGETDASIQVANDDVDKTFSSFVADYAQKLADAESKADDTTQKLAKAHAMSGHMELRSPIDGVVQGLVITTVGQVVTTGEEIMQIVPGDDDLEIECYLPNEDIGFVKPDQVAVVKIQSFPFTRYGTVEAKVTRVARDAIPEPEAQQREEDPAAPPKTSLFGGAERTQNLVFPVTLRLTRRAMNVDGTLAPLIPGMAVTVEIKTGSRRILEYLFSPVVEVASKALKER